MEMLSEKYSLHEIATMDVADLVDYLKEKGRNRFPDPERVARCIQKAARASYHLSKVVEDLFDIVLGTSIQSIRSIQAQLKELDKAIKRILSGIPGAQCLRSIPGIDLDYAAGILAEIGDVDRFEFSFRRPMLPRCELAEAGQTRGFGRNAGQYYYHGSSSLRISAASPIREWLAAQTDPDGKRMHLLSALLHKEGVVVRQKEVDPKPTRSRSFNRCSIVLTFKAK
jgi:hypothetical protein